MVGLPSGATLTPSSTYGKATFHWKPDVVDIGTHQVDFPSYRRRNGNSAISLFAEQTIKVVVRAPQSCADLECDRQSNGPLKTTTDDQLSANDSDNDVLTYSVTNLPVGANFDPVHGVLNWTPKYFPTWYLL